MASKLTLRFSDPGAENASITIATGITYTFKAQRLGFRQVAVGELNTRVKPEQLASNFKNAFEIDDNYTNQFTLTYSATPLDASGVEQTPTGTLDGIVTIEHPDNTFFAGFISNAAFVQGTVTTTPQEAASTLAAVFSQSPTDPCGKYNINIQSNVKSGRVVVEIPVGNQVAESPTGTSGAFNYNLDRVRHPTATLGVVKLYETESATQSIKIEAFTDPGILNIERVDVEGSVFGASATIISHGPGREYSLNGIDWSSSKTRDGLLAGNFTAYVRDQYGCTKTKTFTVTEDQVNGLTAPPYINVPIHNSIRYANRNDGLFLGDLSTETQNHIPISNYCQDYLASDVIRTQFKSSYPDNRAYLIDETGQETELTVLQKSNNISRINIYQGNYANIDGRLAIYFDSGNIYNPDGTPKELGHNLNGLLPGWYEEGMYINIEGVGVTRIDRLKFDEDAEIVYAITQLNGIGTVLNKKITSIHTAHPYEVFEFDTFFNLPEGKYQVRIDYGAGFYLSEIIQVWSELPETYLTVQWFNDVNNDILYNTGIKHLRRIEWEDYFKLVPEAEIESNRTDTSVDKINSKTYAVYNLNFQIMPMEVFRGLQTGFDNSSDIWINGVKFATEKGMEYEDLGQWYLPKTQLTLTDQTMNGRQAIYDAVIPEFLVVEDSNGFSFLNLQT